MIFNIRGTSGSGKSFLVKRIMQTYTYKEPYFREGRKQPFYYMMRSVDRDLPQLGIIGHYNTACGGCDTIKLMDDVVAIVRNLSDEGNHVIFEGVIFSTEYPRTSKMIQDGLPLVVINLTTSLEECIEGVNARRFERNPNLEPVNPANTTRRVGIINRCNERLTLAGGVVLNMDRDQAYRFIMEQINPDYGY